jgi:hypothetical protein
VNVDMSAKLPRRLGRPPIDASGDGTRVSVRLAGVTYDELYAIAAKDGLDVSAVIRDAIRRRILMDRRAAPRNGCGIRK